MENHEALSIFSDAMSIFSDALIEIVSAFEGIIGSRSDDSANGLTWLKRTFAFTYKLHEYLQSTNKDLSQ